MNLAAALLTLVTVTHGAAAQAAQDKVTKKDDVVGTGPVVQNGDILTIDYTGTLKDGTAFDTSIGRQPFQFFYNVGQVIKGMDQGIAGMKEGGKREITIPPSLGYGSAGGDKIPPNSTLHFVVTLKKIEPKVQTDVLTKGTGPNVKFGDTVWIFFTGGVKGSPPIFDSRDKNKDPVPVGIGETHLPIGLSAGIMGMQQGEKRHMFIPPSLAFKDKGIPQQDDGGHKAGSIVPPNSWMEFTVELIKIDPRDQKPAGQ